MLCHKYRQPAEFTINGEVICLSVQNSCTHYCEHRIIMLDCTGVCGTPLKDSQDAEIALFARDDGHWFVPSQLGIDGYDDLFEDRCGNLAMSTVAGWVATATILKLIQNLSMIAEDSKIPEVFWVAPMGPRP